MNKKSLFNMIFSIAFIGVILSFSLYFALTLVLRPEHNIAEGYFGAEEAERTEFSVFDDACLKNKFFHESIIAAEYRMFDHLFGESVISGENGFLFMSGVNSHGYDYIADYSGEVSFDAESLDMIYQYIEMRSKAYENRGMYYCLAVIPNSQTVYSEYMPKVYGEISDRTALSQVEAYLESCGFEGFVDLTDALVAAKGEGLLYNNTENSINALGAYYVYEALMESLPDELVGEGRITERDFYDLYTHYTDGKTAAELAGIQSVLSNETVSMSNATEYMYTTVELFEDIETTYTKSGYRDEVPLKPSVLLELTNEWDKIQLKPYFSNTFGMASYRASHMYSAAALDNSNPTIVIQVLHEDELMTVVEPSVSVSYGEGLEPGQDPYKTTRPMDVEYVLSDENTVCITGMVESGADVSVFGDDFNAYSVDELGGRFVTVLRFDESVIGKEIFIRAKVDGKIVSDPVSILAAKEDLSDTAAGGVLVGNNSMIYYDNYNVPSIPSDRTLDLFSDRVRRTVQSIRRLSDKETRVIYALVPQKLSVYSLGAPAELTDQISDLETLRSLVRVELINADVEAIDLSRVIRQHMNEGKMFAQTTEAMTDLAYYWMYRQIAENIGAVPTEMDSFRSQSYRIVSGIHSLALGFKRGSLPETVDGLIIKNDAQYVQDGGEFIDGSGSFVTYNDAEGLPTAVIVRDGGISTKLFDLLAQHFGTMYVLGENDTDINDEIILSVSPDYVIYLCNEGNIGSLVDG